MNIDQLAKMDDAALSKALGLDAKLAEAKEGIAQLSALEGDARKRAEERIEKMFEPHIWADEFKHIAKSAQRSPEDECNDCSPCSIM